MAVTYTGSDKRLKYLFEHIGDGGGNKIFYGTCDTSASSQAKTATVSSDQNFSLATGVVVYIRFTNTNTYNVTSGGNITLDVNSTGAKIITYGAEVSPTGTAPKYYGTAKYTNCYIYDGTRWVWQGSTVDSDTTYSSKAEAQGGTDVSLVTTGDKYTWNRKVSDNPTFTEASTRANIASGESFATILGKIKKYFTDLKTVAFSGSYNDLSNKPTIPTVPDIADNLTTNDATKVLSAKQGKVLQDTKVNISDIKDNLTSTDTNKPLSAKQGKVLNDNVIDYEKRGYLGKNYLKRPYTYEITGQTSRGGVNYQIHDDGSLTLTGKRTTGQSATYLFLDNAQTPNALNHLIGVPIIMRGTVSNICNIQFWTANGNKTIASDTVFTLTEEDLATTWNVAGAVQYTDSNLNNTVYPMICFATITDTTYQPYIKSNYELENDKVDKVASEIKTNTSGQFDTVTGGKLLSCILAFTPKQSGSGTPSPSNIRPITGHSIVEVGNVGKNKLPLTVSGIKSINTSGTWSGNVYSLYGGTFEILVNGDNVIGIKVNGTFTANTSFYFVATGTSVLSTYLVSGTEYTMNGVPSGTNTVRLDIEYNGSWKTLTTGSTTFTYTSGGEDRVRIYAPANSSASNSIFYPMIRLATDTDATFEPYQGQDVIVNLGNTYYGGTFDFVSGVLTVTHAFVEYDGSNDEDWANGYVRTGSEKRKRVTAPTNIKKPSQSTGIINAISNMYSVVSASNTYDKTQGIACDANGYFFIYDSNYNTDDLTTWKSFLANNHLQIAYELATPLTIQLSPSQINTLVGQNNLSAPLEGQSIQSAQYREVLSWDDVEEKYQYEEAQLTDSNFHARVRRFGRVVNIDFPKPLYPMGTSEDSWISLGILPERFYHKYPNPMIEVSIYATIATFVDDSNDIVPVLVRINQFSGEVLGYFKAENYVQPFGTITYILDHD